MSQNGKSFREGMRGSASSLESEKRTLRFEAKVAKWTRFFGLSGLAALTLVQYQNCAPNSKTGSTTSASIAAPAGDGINTTIDNPNGVSSAGSGVSFLQSSVQLRADVQSVTLQGTCPSDQDGAMFEWQLNAQTGDPLGEGIAHCSSGSFSVEIAPTQSLTCNTSYTVQARLGLGQTANVLVTRLCAPASSVAASSASPDVVQQIDKQLNSNPNSTCDIESRPGDGATGCMSVCYSASGVLESSEDLPASACAVH